MKKVAIMTFHRAINYGALMQAYALQEKLKECGADSYMLDYRSKPIEDAYRLTWGLNKKKWSSWKTTIKGMPSVQRKKNRFRAFGSKYLHLTKSCNASNVAKVCAGYDAIVTGSDQVWNMDVCGQDHCYMLDFIDDSKKKCSYAVSLGAYKLTPEEEKLAASFSMVSMREKGTGEYISGVIGRDVHTDLDPTLLLTKEQWEKVVLKKRVIEKPYIFIYSVHPQNRMVAFAKKLAKEKGLEIYHLHNRVKKDLKEDGVHLMFDASPEEFLTLIHDAEYVVTNSFHGTVFSIIFQKQFLSELETKGGFNNRVWELLNKLGIRRRILETVEGVNDGVTIDETIDWKMVDQKMKEHRAHSVEFVEKLAK